MKKFLVLISVLLIVVVVINLGEKDNDIKYSAEMKEVNKIVSSNELTQEKINLKASQIKMVFDNIDNKTLRGHDTVGSLEHYFATFIMDKKLAKEFVRDNFKMENNKITYIQKPELFDYEKNRTVTKVTEGIYTVKQDKILLTFQYEKDIKDWKIKGILYL